VILSKRLHITELVYETVYIIVARDQICYVGLEDRVKVVCMSIYETQKKLRGLIDLLNENDDVDADFENRLFVDYSVQIGRPIANILKKAFMKHSIIKIIKHIELCFIETHSWVKQIHSPTQITQYLNIYLSSDRSKELSHIS